MRDRPMLLVSIEDEDGVTGWGEVWCNFPACGAEHRARLIASVFAPMLIGRSVSDPPAIFEDLTRRTRILALQSGERGPIAQCIAGLDLAIWDLIAKRCEKPLWRLLGGSDPSVAVYASGLNPIEPERIAVRKYDEGFRAFKLKVGFGRERDIGNLDTLRRALGGQALLMADANQAWDLAEASAAACALERFALAWLEEPLAADAPSADWMKLAKSTSIPLAAGENYSSPEQFTAALASRICRVLQPDVAKWGGFSGCLPIARRIVEAGLIFCPHYLAGVVGLVASAHLLSAVGGSGMLEIDANENVLRTALDTPLQRITDGRTTLTDAPGLGLDVDLVAFERYRVEDHRVVA
jgi:D-galactarolactone cycloisomerase